MPHVLAVFPDVSEAFDCVGDAGPSVEAVYIAQLVKCVGALSSDEPGFQVVRLNHRVRGAPDNNVFEQPTTRELPAYRKRRHGHLGIASDLS